LQHVDRLDVARVQEVDVVEQHAVDDVERRCVVERADTADAHDRADTRLTRLRCDLHPRHASLERLHRRGRRDFRDLLARHARDRARHVAALLCAVADRHDLLERDRLRLERDVDRAAPLDRNALLREADAAEDECAVAVRHTQQVAAVRGSDHSDVRALDRYGHTRERPAILRGCDQSRDRELLGCGQCGCEYEQQRGRHGSNDAPSGLAASHAHGRARSRTAPNATPYLHSGHLSTHGLHLDVDGTSVASGSGARKARPALRWRAREPWMHDYGPSSNTGPVTWNCTCCTSCELPPTITVNEPGSTTSRMAAFQNARSRGWSVNETVRVSPGRSVIRRKPRSLRTAGVIDATSSRT